MCMSDDSPPIPPRFPADSLTIYRRQKISRERDRYLVDAVQQLGRAVGTIEGVDCQLEGFDLPNADCISDADPEEVETEDEGE